MANRKRKIVLRVPVTPEERALIQQKMAQLGTKNFSAYARKMLIDGYIVHIDTGPVRAQTAELQKIGVNINQIARRINSTGTVYAQDLEDIKGALAQIWQLQRSIRYRLFRCFCGFIICHKHLPPVFWHEKRGSTFQSSPVGSSSFLRHDTKIPPVVSFGRYFV